MFNEFSEDSQSTIQIIHAFVDLLDLNDFSLPHNTYNRITSS